jgi:uncharacterized membrane protein
MPLKRDAPAEGGPVTGLRDAHRVAQFHAPFHPISAHFTIALTASSFAFDAGALVFRVESLAAAGWWTLAASTVLTLLTLATGITSRLRLPMEEGEARSVLRIHMALGPTFYGLLLATTIWRAAFWERGVQVPIAYLGVLGAVVLVMSFQGYLGGELVYRYGAEVTGRYRRLQSAEADVPRESRRTA